MDEYNCLMMILVVNLKKQRNRKGNRSSSYNQGLITVDNRRNKNKNIISHLQTGFMMLNIVQFLTDFLGVKNCGTFL